MKTYVFSKRAANSQVHCYPPLRFTNPTNARRTPSPSLQPLSQGRYCGIRLYTESIRPFPPHWLLCHFQRASVKTGLRFPPRAFTTSYSKLRCTIDSPSIFSKLTYRQSPPAPPWSLYARKRLLSDPFSPPGGIPRPYSTINAIETSRCAPRLEAVRIPTARRETKFAQLSHVFHSPRNRVKIP